MAQVNPGETTYQPQFLKAPASWRACKLWESHGPSPEHIQGDESVLPPVTSPVCSPSAPRLLSALPLTWPVPSDRDATLHWQARQHLPGGDFTTPITLTTAQIKPCHWSHKQQCNRAAELRVTEEGRERERAPYCTSGTQSPALWLGRYTQTAPGGKGEQAGSTGFEPSTTPY